MIEGEREEESFVDIVVVGRRTVAPFFEVSTVVAGFKGFQGKGYRWNDMLLHDLT